MAISVSSLGTAQGKAVLAISLNVTLSAGDWIVVCSAADNSWTDCILTQGGIGASDLVLIKLKETQFLGGVDSCSQIWAAKVLSAVSSKSVTVSYVNSQAGAIAVYKVTGINRVESVPDISPNGQLSIGNGGFQDRLGNVISNPVSGAQISSIDFNLFITGSPANTVYCRVRKLSDGSIVGTIDSVSAATLVNGWNTFSGTAVTIPNEPIVITVEYQGDSSNYISLYTNTNTTFPFIYQWLYTGSSGITSKDYARSVSWRNVNLQYLNPYDTSIGAYGTGTSLSSGNISTAIADEILIAAFSTEGPNGDAAGTWDADVDQNNQRLGTTGSGATSNQTVAAAAEIKSAIGTYSAGKTGITSRDATCSLIALKQEASGNQYTQSIGGAFSSAQLLGAIGKRPGKAVAGAFSAAQLTGSFSRLIDIHKTFTGSILNTALLGATFKQTRKTLAGAFSNIQLTGIIAAGKLAYKSISGAILNSALIGGLTKRSYKTFTGAFSSAQLIGSFSRIITMYKTFTGAIANTALVGTLAKIPNKLLTGAMTALKLLGDTQAVKTSRTIYQTITGEILNSALLGGITKRTGKGFSGAFSNSQLTGDFSRIASFHRSVAGAFSNIQLAGAMTTAKIKIMAISGQILNTALIGSLSRQTRKTFAGAFSSAQLVGTATKKMFKTFAGAFSNIQLTGVIATAKVFLKSFSGTILNSALIGGLTKRPDKAFTGSLNTTGTFARIASLHRSFTGAFSNLQLTGTVVKLPIKVVKGTLTTIGVASRKANKFFVGVLSSTGGLTKRMTKILSGVLSSIGSLLSRWIQLGGIRYVVIVASARNSTIAGHARSAEVSQSGRSYTIEYRENIL